MAFDAVYSQNPWSDLESTKRNNWYEPILANVYMRDSIYNQYIVTEHNLGAIPSQKTTHTDIIPPRPSLGDKDNYQLWFDSGYMNTLKREITYKFRNGKLQWHEFDQIMFYLRQRGVGGLAQIIANSMAQMIKDTMDINAFHAFLTHPYFYNAGTGTGSKFSLVTAGDTLTTEALNDLWLGAHSRVYPWEMLPNPKAPTGMVCITSPGVVHDLRNEVNTAEGTGFIDTVKYANPSALMNAIMGTYKGITFIGTPMAILYNCGDFTAQWAIAAPAKPIDGAPDPGVSKVDMVYMLGEDSVAGQKHYLQMEAGGTVGFAVNDIVTIHKLRTNDFGVTDGVDYRDPSMIAGFHESRIVSIDAGNNRIVINRPLGASYETDLGGGVYGYVTKGKNIHTGIFLGSNTGVARGIVTPPKVMFPPTIDDAMAMQRITWKGYYGENLWQPEVFEVWVGSGSERNYGAKIAG